MRTHHGRRDPTLLSTVLAVSLLGIAVLGLLRSSAVSGTRDTPGSIASRDPARCEASPPTRIGGAVMNDTFPWQALGAVLAAARQRRALSQKQVAHQLGISQAADSLFERGIIRPRPVRLCQLADTLGLDVTHLAALAGYPLEQVLGVSRSDLTSRRAG
jgi:ribosome-binding protein aMBF1 (putative translation factor)